MKAYHFAGIALLTLMGSASAHAKTADGWEYVGTDRNVTVYKKGVEGTDIVAFRGVAYADVHIGKLFQVFRDPKEREHWVDRYAGHETLATAPGEETYWIHFGLPWPVSDRDYVLRSVAKLAPDERKLTVEIESVEHANKPKQDCCVRAIAYSTFYEFTAIPGEEKTKLIVEVHTDPKGSIPSWLVNLIQKSWPAKTLDGLIQRTKEAGAKPVASMSDWHRPKEASASAD